MLRRFSSTKGAHYNGRFGIVASASEGGRHKVELVPPNRETVSIKIENLDFLKTFKKQSVLSLAPLLKEKWMTKVK